jgi:hypothetical protein
LGPAAATIEIPMEMGLFFVLPVPLIAYGVAMLDSILDPLF